MMSTIVISIACFINIAICIHATMKIIDIHCARHEDEDLQDYVLNLMRRNAAHWAGCAWRALMYTEAKPFSSTAVTPRTWVSRSIRRTQ